jgi:amidase
MESIYELSASRLAIEIALKKISAVEVAQAFIDRIHLVNPKLNAIHQVNPEQLLMDAKQLDKASVSGNPLGKLHGVPISIKDACHVKGFKCSKGFRGFLNNPSTYDATVVNRLKTEGALILGITNVPELLLSYETDNLIYGRTNNPYDMTKTPGGSSGGEAAIIAAGGSMAGIGSDAGGSIRQPAHYSGICAHKPTQGFVPMTGGIPVDGAGIVSQIVSLGPMARHVEDLSLIMDIITGADGYDPHAAPIKFISPDNVDIKKLRVAYFYGNEKTYPSEETIKTMDSVINILKKEVAVIQEAYPEPIKDIYKLHWETFMLGGDGGQSLLNLYNTFSITEISSLAHQFIKSAKNCIFSTAELRARLLDVEKFRYKMMQFVQNYDVIISPVAATPARAHGETHANIHDFSYVIVHNLTGWPATVVPCGKSKEGLPIGIQIAAKPWHDHVCLALSKKLQRIIGVFDIPPI